MNSKRTQMFTINGTIICNGYGRASSALKIQIPLISKIVPEIQSMHPGTINVQLENPLSVARFDEEVKDLEWRPGYIESFGIVRAEFLPEGKKFKSPVPCLLYFPSTSPHRLNPFMVEVITEKLDLELVSKCSLLFNQPSRKVEWVVVGKTAWVQD